jgi:hypothetical protein
MTQTYIHAKKNEEPLLRPQKEICVRTHTVQKDPPYALCLSTSVCLLPRLCSYMCSKTVANCADIYIYICIYYIPSSAVCPACARICVVKLSRTALVSTHTYIHTYIHIYILVHTPSSAVCPRLCSYMCSSHELNWIICKCTCICIYICIIHLRPPSALLALVHV